MAEQFTGRNSQNPTWMYFTLDIVTLTILILAADRLYPEDNMVLLTKMHVLEKLGRHEECYDVCKKLIAKECKVRSGHSSAIFSAISLYESG